ncbi:MAG TPA: biopolymer transporter ExbD [Candidatus Tenderia electrophaga]|uniref:Biopolymer transporter ExbD n=1 Tax=Candidatus Tenderia electrophaga TaxID=1748243 RepID=A0A832J994_9GAMM|nr:biopolymer transporter ExbD [Candidatus Tenderia electrophaga]
MASRFRRPHRQAADLDITAFMNLMVILVPFLLITAVFNQVSVLEMNLPEQKAADKQTKEKPPEFQLQIILRKDVMQVSDKPGRILKTFAMKGDSYDVEGLSDLLRSIKARMPDETAATLLLEPDVAYDHLIQIMDTTRVIEITEDNKSTQYELFPDIAMGDAPAVKGRR